MTSRDAADYIATLEREIHRLRVKAQRDTEALNEAEENARVYRRLAYRLAERLNELDPPEEKP